MKKLSVCILLLTFLVCSCSSTDPLTGTEDIDLTSGHGSVWVLEGIDGKQLTWGKMQKRPQIEIDVQKMTISGNDGCNNFFGGIETVDSEKLVFSNIAVTRKACIDMDIPDRFSQYINTIRAYSITDLKLHLFDDQGNERFVFKKAD